MKLTILFTLGVLCTSSFSIAQNKNSVAIQTGLLHYFFDGSPVMNFDYPNSAKKPFNGLLINSVGIRYVRKLTEESFIMLTYESFRESYDKHLNAYPIEEPIVEHRYFSTVRLNYGRLLPISEKFAFVYGGGVNFRTGSEAVIIARGIISDNPNGPVVYEILAENLGRNDFGLNAFAGVEYNPKSWLTIYANCDFLTSILLNDKQGKKEMEEVYESPQFPSRYDLSLNLGVGFNF